MVSRSIAELRPRLPGARWVTAEGYHLTLQFLGEIEDALISVLGEQLGPVFEGHGRISVQLGAGGTFPRGRAARIAWIGIEDPGPVVELAQDVQAKCTALDVQQEKRSFMRFFGKIADVPT